MSSPMPPEKTEQPLDITIDGKTYKIADLSAEAQNQIRNIQEVDRKTVAAQNEIKALQTWRTVHSHSLNEELKKME
ncbi:hypothetical protein JM93_01975 [Roseibium hamelinense]|uniref:Cell division protein ZapA n=1 Tax=Roseibium hamelinense TaxID=150831 RepID=A0A562T3H2_9HYPH|nr:DUF6447 family protein [Roseibium hamelinense]MTI44444.1 hypothetical protein [Roseibium hamelinense]TWI87410.1 hypothetical protein JM93_01975 [Roseibium hamelinense]